MTSNTLEHDIKVNNAYITSSYNFGKVDETISRIENKLEDLCNELKSLTTILENCNGK
jgi:hypothetical protein